MKLKSIKRRLGVQWIRLSTLPEEWKATELVFNKQRPIYHVHIRKTAGTTINQAFLSNTAEDASQLMKRLGQKNNHQIIIGERVFVGWNRRLIEKGQYSFAFSHTPLHQLKLPENAYTFTCFRDPVNRVISHYNMLRGYQEYNIPHAWMKAEDPWLGNSFDDFLSRIPREHLLNQLYMFSPSFDVEEALANIQKLDHILYTEQIVQGLKELESATGWTLPLTYENKSAFRIELSDSQQSQLRAMLEPEYKLFEQLRK